DDRLRGLVVWALLRTIAVAEHQIAPGGELAREGKPAHAAVIALVGEDNGAPSLPMTISIELAAQRGTILSQERHPQRAAAPRGGRRDNRARRNPRVSGPRVAAGR